jgi:hypothetical protein
MSRLSVEGNGGSEMKNAKLALVAAFVMTVLSSGRCVVMLFLGTQALNHETNPAFQTTGETQTALQEQLQTGLRENFIHHDQIALYGATGALAWNLLLAGLLIFAIIRFPKSN